MFDPTSSKNSSDSGIRKLIELPSMTAAYNWEERSSKSDYHIYLTELFDQYSALLDQEWDITLSPNGEISFSAIIQQSAVIAKKLMEEIVDSIGFYLCGNLFKSSAKFNDALDDLFPYLNESRFVHTDDTTRWQNFSVQFGCNASENLVSAIAPSALFRVQKVEESKISKNRMLHPPYEKRKKIGTERFSIPGYPCLYLGSSIYVCLKEMGITFPYNETKKPYCSLYWWQRRVDNPRLMELHLIPEYFARYCDSLSKCNSCDWDVHRKFILSYLACWPLQLACSIPVKFPDAKFKEEYIIPQLLMMWLRNQKRSEDIFHGICYRSTRIPESVSKKQSKHFLNYAIPVFSHKDKGYCDELKRIFSIYEPEDLSKSFLEEIPEENVLENCINLEARMVNQYIENNGPPFTAQTFRSYF